MPVPARLLANFAAAAAGQVWFSFFIEGLADHDQIHIVLLRQGCHLGRIQQARNMLDHLVSGLAIVPVGSLKARPIRFSP